MQEEYSVQADGVEFTVSGDADAQITCSCIPLP